MEGGGGIICFVFFLVPQGGVSSRVLSRGGGGTTCFVFFPVPLGVSLAGCLSEW